MSENARKLDVDKNTTHLNAAKDPGAVPRKDLKDDKIAVVHSSDLDSEPSSEIYEAYEDSHDRVNHPDEPHKSIP